ARSSTRALRAPRGDRRHLPPAEPPRDAPSRPLIAHTSRCQSTWCAKNGPTEELRKTSRGRDELLRGSRVGHVNLPRCHHRTRSAPPDGARSQAPEATPRLPPGPEALPSRVHARRGPAEDRGDGPPRGDPVPSVLRRDAQGHARGHREAAGMLPAGEVGMKPSRMWPSIVALALALADGGSDAGG